MLAEELLRASGITFAPFAASRVFISPASQLFGPYANLKDWQATTAAYFRWEAHHVLEKDDIKRLGAQHRFPSSNEQLCVLLPSSAHRERINQVLRSANPVGMIVSASDLVPAYVTAYQILGNYCGGGEAAIQGELMAIVRAALHYIAK